MKSSSKKNKFTFIDLFAGAGGLSKGFEMAGMECIGALDNFKEACKTHELNFPNNKCIHADITKLSPNAFSKKIGRKKVDVIVGGPPCPTFSTIGGPKIKSLMKDSGGDIFKDKRNFLFRDFFRYIEFFNPKMFVMENVPNFITKYNGKIFQQTLKRIDQLGYIISNNNVRVLNAADYGVPQLRKRMLLVAHKKKISFSYPEPTHYEGDGMLDFGKMKKYVDVQSAISDLPKITDNWRESESPYVENKKLTEYQKIMRKNNRKKTVMNNICRMTNERAKKVFSHMKQGQKYMDLPKEVRNILPFREDIFHDRLKRLVNSKPSWTVLAHIGMDGYMYIHPTEKRTISVREAARIQSFPDDFVFAGNQMETYVQVGNAVPVLLAKAIGKSVLKSLKLLEN